MRNDYTSPVLYIYTIAITITHTHIHLLTPMRSVRLQRFEIRQNIIRPRESRRKFRERVTWSTFIYFLNFTFLIPITYYLIVRTTAQMCISLFCIRSTHSYTHPMNPWNTYMMTQLSESKWIPTEDERSTIDYSMMLVCDARKIIVGFGSHSGKVYSSVLHDQRKGFKGPRNPNLLKLIHCLRFISISIAANLVHTIHTHTPIEQNTEQTLRWRPDTDNGCFEKLQLF